ncbi:MAG TPA: formylglycine-generating enzyme family protein [Draconibacterium sp.]|nr:formylglycine-generating enzyme family protein [Draconibacterium sp.]
MLGKVTFFLIILFLNGCTSKQKSTFSTWKEPVTGIEFVLIPKGSFLMGNLENKNNKSGSDIQHKVKISKDFWLGRMEVTREQWEKIMGDDEIHPEKPSPFHKSDTQYPIVNISFFDIQRFLERLNKLSQGHHFRLPTEAEWEYACRAGTTTPFSFGLKLTDSLANYNATIPSAYSTPGKYIGHPVPVGSYLSNQWGLCDMHGNVWEWVSDWYAPYSSEPATDPHGSSSGKFKVIRGGSWYFGAGNAWSSFRRTHEPGLWGFSIGFRVACEKAKQIF